MSSHQDDLDLLLSLEDRVLETPPASPSTHHSQLPDYLSDHGSPRQVRNSDMSVFKDAVRDYLENEPSNVNKAPKLNRSKHLNDVDVEKFSGLRIRNLLVSAEELSNHFSDIRFVRLPAIRNLLVGDTISGSWATVGVLTENGISKVGTVFALFNSGVRKDNEGNGFSLSVFSPGQILKMGTSVDYGVCKGKRRDGMVCSVVINKRRGVYCKYHTSNASQKYTVTRSELKGGNLKTAFRNPLQAEGIYLVDPLADKRNIKKAMQPVKVLSVDGLKKALSKAGKVTTNAHSQGIRFLTEVTGKMCPKDLKGGSATSNQQKDSTVNRLSSTKMSSSTTIIKDQPEAKRKKTGQPSSSTTIIKDQPEANRKKTEQPTEKMIEIDLFSSDEEE